MCFVFENTFVLAWMIVAIAALPIRWCIDWPVDFDIIFFICNCLSDLLCLFYVLLFNNNEISFFLNSGSEDRKKKKSLDHNSRNNSFMSFSCFLMVAYSPHTFFRF